MRFRVERDSLSDAVAWTARALPARPHLPVLAGLLLEATGQELTISGFDYEISTQAVVTDIAAAEAGRALVPGKLLADITRSLPAAPVEVATEGSALTLRCGAARFSLPTRPVEDYPTLPELPAVSGTIGSDDFAAAVASVAVAAGHDVTLPVLTGIRVEIDGDHLTLVATDRYRLALRELHWRPTTADIKATALVPARTLADTAKSLTSGAEVTVALSTGGAGEGMIGFVGGSKRTTTRLLDGEFPKYRNLLPANSAATAEVETSVLVEAVRRVALVASRGTPVRLAFDAEELVLSAEGDDQAQASEAVPLTYHGEPLTIAFNPTFLLDGLAALDSDVARLSFTTASKPVVITGKEPVGDYRYLLMPIRLSG
jgi:DNA polymerase-3 subunit beta